MMKAISGLNQSHVNSSYSTDGGHFPELLLWWNGSINMGGCLCLPFPAQQPAGFSTSRGMLVLSLPFLPPLLGYIPVTALPPPHPPTIATTPLFLHPTRPAPLCSVRSPALFVQMEQKRKWKPESTVNPFLGLCSTIVCIPVVFHVAVSTFDDDLNLHWKAVPVFVLF